MADSTTESIKDRVDIALQVLQNELKIVTRLLTVIGPYDQKYYKRLGQNASDTIKQVIEVAAKHINVRYDEIFQHSYGKSQFVSLGGLVARQERLTGDIKTTTALKDTPEAAAYFELRDTFMEASRALRLEAKRLDAVVGWTKVFGVPSF